MKNGRLVLSEKNWLKHPLPSHEWVSTALGDSAVLRRHRQFKHWQWRPTERRWGSLHEVLPLFRTKRVAEMWMAMVKLQ